MADLSIQRVLVRLTYLEGEDVMLVEVAPTSRWGSTFTVPMRDADDDAGEEWKQ